MDYLLDTNIVLIYSRDNDLSRAIERKHQLFRTSNRTLLSIVTVGELNALSKKLNLGQRRRDQIQRTIDTSIIVDISNESLIETYGDIDYLTSGKIDVRVHGDQLSARNMGKNDIWIAATTRVFDLTLVTTDKDFQVLHPDVIDLLYVDLDALREEMKA